MEAKELTLEALETQRPDLVEAISKDLKEAATKEVSESVKKERARVLGIIDKAKAYEDVGVADIVRASIDSGDEIIVAENKLKDKKLEVLNKAGNKSPGADGDTVTPESHMAKAKAYAEANKCSMAQALSATAEVRKAKTQ